MAKHGGAHGAPNRHSWRNWLTSCLAALRSNLIGCHNEMVLNLKNLCQAWPEDHLCQVSRLDKICIRRCIFKFFDINQDGGKSIITQNDAIWCVELGLAQGFQ